jgi:protein involved in polysaccharide export with SLBB domain
MYKTLLLVSLALFAFFPGRVAGQATGGKNQTPTNIKNQKDPISAAPTSPVLTGRAAEARRFYLEGQKLAEAKQFPQAAENFQQALRIDSEYADAYSALGRTFFKLREWEKAIDNLHRATELRAKQRETRDWRYQQPAMQERDESGTLGNANSTTSQIKAPYNTNTAGVKTLQPEPRTTPSEPRQETAVSPKPAVAKLEGKHPAANTNAAVVQRVQPEPDMTAAERREETKAPLKTTATGPENKQPATNANTAGLKTLQPQSQTTNAVKSALTKQPIANAAGVKGLPPPSGAKEDLEEPAVVSSLTSEDGGAVDQRQQAVGVRTSMHLTPSSKPLDTKPPSSTSPEAPNDDLSLTKIYRVGPNDVLDIRLSESESAKSTLFTVAPSGFIEYPILNEPLPVAGLTVDEIATKIEGELSKRALVENPKVLIGVRDYASHSILVSGLVKAAGTRFLRREGIPLYVVVADSQPEPEAARVTIVRNEQRQIYEIDLTQAADVNLLVRQGDVITFQPNVTQFIYIAGEVKNAGEKTFRRGLSLTQAIISAGGTNPKSRVAQLSRADGRGFLVETRFNLKDIGSGEVVDPLLKPGDRIVILR